jgi:nucleoside-diphosphate-sugar epimerase
MNILITGAGGFLGSNICNLLSEKHNIMALSRKFDKVNLDKNIICHNIDMADYVNLKEQINNFHPDVVIHCAWIGGNSSKDINELWQANNIIYSNELLKFCTALGVKHFIGFGSSAEYGNHLSKLDEETICKPTNMYGITKNCFRSVAQNFCESNDINFSWIRPVFTYGPRDIETRLIPKTILSLLRNEHLVLNKCSAIVDYLYVEDFCRAIKCIVEQELFGDFTISSNVDINVKNLVQIIYEKIGSKSDLVFDHSLPDYSHQFICGSSEKLISLSDWSPVTSLDKGLDNTISYFEKFV